MTHRGQADRFFKNRNQRRERMLRKLSNMRAAKERKRLANPVEREPKFERWYPLELGVRDKRNGETAWVELRSVRDAARRLSVVLKHFVTYGS